VTVLMIDQRFGEMSSCRQRRAEYRATGVPTARGGNDCVALDWIGLDSRKGTMNSLITTYHLYIYICKRLSLVCNLLVHVYGRRLTSLFFKDYHALILTPWKSNVLTPLRHAALSVQAQHSRSLQQHGPTLLNSPQGPRARHEQPRRMRCCL
jgi:hypothetical protein